MDGSIDGEFGDHVDCRLTFQMPRATEMTGPLKPWHAEFLQTLMAEYGGEKLTKVVAIMFCK